MHVMWIGGWGVAPECLRPAAERFLPGASHAFFPPTDSAAEVSAAGELVVGWSLGAWRILAAAARGVRFRRQVVLLAPFVAFCSEFGLGGRCSQTQVRWLARWLQRDAPAALQDFYSRAGLGTAPAQLPCAVGELLAGLEVLGRDASPALRDFAAAGLPADWQAVVGDNDPLLEATGVTRALPGCRVLAGAGHRAEDLIEAIATHQYAV